MLLTAAVGIAVFKRCVGVVPVHADPRTRAGPRAGTQQRTAIVCRKGSASGGVSAAGPDSVRRESTTSVVDKKEPAAWAYLAKVRVRATPDRQSNTTAGVDVRGSPNYIRCGPTTDFPGHTRPRVHRSSSGLADDAKPTRGLPRREGAQHRYVVTSTRWSAGSSCQRVVSLDRSRSWEKIYARRARHLRMARRGDMTANTDDTTSNHRRR